MNIFYGRTWAEVNLDVLRDNIEIIRGIAGKKQVAAVVKANAYGHGDVFCARTLNKCGITRFTVSNLWEAQRLFDNEISGKILIFGYCRIEEIFDSLGKNFIYTVGDVDYAKKVSEEALKRNVKVPVHIKIDTGMSRVGITTEEQLDEILAMKGLDCEAAYTHFAVADSLDEKDIEFTEAQQKKIISLCRKKGLKFHSQNSGGIIYHKDFDGDFVRAGIIMYGQKPDPRFPVPDGIKPVMSVKSVVSQLKTIHAGDTVSYGRTFKADKDVKLALIPCGYADGFNRRLSGQWYVTIRGKKAPVCGRICMDQTLVDVTDIPDVQAGDVVTVYSDEIEGGNSFTAAAEKIGTINYELLCAVGTRVPRIYIENGAQTELDRYL